MRHVSIHHSALLWVYTALVVLGLLGYRELQLQPDGKLHVHFLDVDQGDATLLVTPSGKQILIDGGPNMDTLEHLGRFLPFFDREIDLLVLTHPNADHLMALPDVLQRYHVQQILLSGADYPLQRYKAMVQEILSRNISVVLADPAKDIDMGDGTVLDVLWPGPEQLDNFDVNNASVVVRVLFGEHAILLPGDIEEEAEIAMLLSGGDIRADVLKLPHHGSMSSSSTGLLLAVKPGLGIVSAGRNNRFGHPHAEVIERYENMGIPLRSTAKEGTISLTFTR
jgi:competence protein ComEC|tara:strand:- start:992 stop:1834 length:843 start_codon:yes stop_codon:yes gene_type:complete